MLGILLSAVIAFSSAIKKEVDFEIENAGDTVVVCTLGVNAEENLGVSIFTHSGASANISIILEEMQNWASTKGPYEFLNETISVPVGNHYTGGIIMNLEPFAGYIVKISADRDLMGKILLKAWR